MSVMVAGDLAEMDALVTTAALTVIGTLVCVSLRRAWLSRSPNWWLYCAYSGVAANAMLSLALLQNFLPATAPLPVAAVAFVTWLLLRRFCALRKSAHSVWHDRVY